MPVTCRPARSARRGGRGSPTESCRSSAAISRTSIAIVALRAEDHDLVARRHVEAGDVDHQHVHAHRADDRRAAAANQHGAAAGEPQVEAVGVAGRHDGDRRRPLGGEARAVADASRRRARPSPRRRGCASDITGVERQRRRQRRRHDAVEQEARAGRGRTRRASRAAARRCWRRDGSAGRPPSAVDVGQRLLEARALLVEQRRLGIVGGARSACRPRRARGSGSPAAPAACAAGCRSRKPEPVHARCRSSGDSAARCL